MQSEVSSEVTAQGVPTVDFDNPVIDPANPGFASLLPVLQGILDGEVDDTVLQDYVTHLRPRVNQAYDQVQSMMEQPYQQMGFAEEHLTQLQSAFAATQAAVQELHQVLLLCESYLQTHEEQTVVEAEERLASVQNELRQVL